MAQPAKIAFEHAVANGMAHQGAGRLSEAEAAYRAALAIVPGHALVTHNLGIIAAARGDHRAALGYFDEVTAAQPHYASAHYNRGVALIALDRLRDAIQSLSRACVVEPEHYSAHRALAFLWLGEGERGRALDHFARTYELRRGEDRTGIAATSLVSSTRSKLRHDAEQFRFLSRRRRDSVRFEALARAYEQVATTVPQEVTPLSGQQLEVLGDDYNTAISIASAPEIAGGAVSERPDRDELVRRFTSEQTGAVTFDGLLAPRALHLLQQYLLESTIWHDFSHIEGFVASYLEDGLACPLLLQIADELRGVFPELIGQHPLSQAWAFKAVNASAAVDVHADDAAVSVNLWITPTEANLSPGRGGLTVCRAPPPADWRLQDFDADQTRIVTFLKQNTGNELTVTYRQNRAVLFESRLFHHSDMPQFAETYENHRINVTLLFGRQRSTAQRVT
jgi:tetratricopeptide (TPR) repeat protein